MGRRVCARCSSTAYSSQRGVMHNQGNPAMVARIPFELHRHRSLPSSTRFHEVWMSFDSDVAAFIIAKCVFRGSLVLRFLAGVSIVLKSYVHGQKALRRDRREITCGIEQSNERKAMVRKRSNRMLLMWCESCRAPRHAGSAHAEYSHGYSLKPVPFPSPRLSHFGGCNIQAAFIE
jgi:hypothetical protein